MGYRRAAMMRRTQHVSSHTRNAPLYKPNETAFVFGMIIAGFFTFGITWIALVAYFIITAKN